MCFFNHLSFSPQVVRQVSTGDVVLTEVVLSGSGKMLFAGGSSGCVRSLKFPLTEAGEFTEHQAHSASVTRVSGHVISHKKAGYMHRAGPDARTCVITSTFYKKSAQHKSLSFLLSNHMHHYSSPPTIR